MRKNVSWGLILAACLAAGTGAATDQRIEYPRTRRVEHVDDYFGVKVADPYRWLEDDVRTSHEVADWVAAENKVTERYLESIPQRATIRRRLTELWNFTQYGGARKAGGRYYYMKNDGLQNQPVLYVLDSLRGRPRVILDPNTWSKDGTIALAGAAFSDDGRYLAYCSAEAGSDWLRWRVLEIASAKLLGDELRWCKSPSASWSHDGQGFFYSRDERPKPGAEFQALNFNNRLCYHRVGTPQADDATVYFRPEHPQWQYDGTATEDGRYLVITTELGTDERYRITVKDLAKPDSAPIELIDNFEHEYSFVGNDGPTLYFKTDLNAPLGRLIAIDLGKPEPRNWQEIIPQTPDTLEAVSFVGDRFIASYLKNVQPLVRVFSRLGQFLHDVKLPGIGTAAGFGGKRTDNETFYTFSSFATPPTVYHYDVASGASSLFRSPEVKFDPAPSRWGRPSTRARTARACPCSSPIRRASRGTALPRRCCTAMAGSTFRCRRCSPSAAWRGWRWGACTRRRTSAAAANSATPGTRRAPSCGNRTSSTTSSPPPNGSSPPNSPAATAWPSKGAATAAC